MPGKKWRTSPPPPFFSFVFPLRGFFFSFFFFSETTPLAETERSPRWRTEATDSLDSPKAEAEEEEDRPRQESIPRGGGGGRGVYHHHSHCYWWWSQWDRAVKREDRVEEQSPRARLHRIPFCCGYCCCSPSWPPPSSSLWCCGVVLLLRLLFRLLPSPSAPSLCDGFSFGYESTDADWGRRTPPMASRSRSWGRPSFAFCPPTW